MCDERLHNIHISQSCTEITYKTQGTNVYKQDLEKEINMSVRRRTPLIWDQWYTHTQPDSKVGKKTEVK